MPGRGRPFKKGDVNNPRGRAPNTEGISALIRALLAAKGPDGQPYREVIARKLLTMATNGDLDAIKVVLDRSDGKVPEVRQITADVLVELAFGDDGDEMATD